MEIIDFEIDEINKICENVISNSKVVTCLRSLIRIDIKQTNTRQITICLRFPCSYPNQPVLVELKSRTLCGKLLDGLTTLAEQKAKEFRGKPQVLIVIKFIENYLRENPLCIVYDEIAAIKALLNNDGQTTGGELKCRQKTSSVSLLIKGGSYYFKAKIHIPEDYPMKCIYWLDYDSNLPVTLVRFLNGQAKEIARKCVEAPLCLDRTKDTFEVKPSFQRTLAFLIVATQDFHIEMCPICKEKCLPNDASNIETIDTSDNYIERVYCGHIYHQGCLKRFMREPPFPSGGKLCPAPKKHPRSDRKKTPKNLIRTTKTQLQMNDSCQMQLSHDRWGLSVKLAEARWAQQQARERELEEVIDFLQ